MQKAEPDEVPLPEDEVGDVFAHDLQINEHFFDLSSSQVLPSAPEGPYSEIYGSKSMYIHRFSWYHDHTAHLKAHGLYA